MTAPAPLIPSPEASAPLSEVPMIDPRAEVAAIFDIYKQQKAPDADPATLADAKSDHFGKLSTFITDEAAENPANEPASVLGRIVKAYRGLDVEKNRFDSDKIDSVSAAVSRYPLNLERIRQLNLSPFDEMTLLKGAAVAGGARNTPQGEALKATALSLLKHELTNDITLSHTGERGDRPAFMEAYKRVVFAQQALGELRAREGARELTSIDENLIVWDDLVQRPEETVPMIPSIVTETGEQLNPDIVQFLSISEAERDKRLEIFDKIKLDLQYIFGEDCEVDCFETIVFDDDAKNYTKTAGQEKTAHRESEPGKESDERLSGGLFKDYIIAKVTEHLKDGGVRIHIIGESPNPDNACYVLRGDVAAEVSQMVGSQMEGLDFFRLRKNAARQMGARDFRHAKNGDVHGNVIRYLNTNITDIMGDFAAKFTDAGKAPFDRDLNPSRFNRLPKALTRAITGNGEVALKLLDRWRKGALHPRLGRTALLDEAEEGPELSMAELKEKLAATEERARMLEEELNKLRRAG